MNGDACPAGRVPLTRSSACRPGRHAVSGLTNLPPEGMRSAGGSPGDPFLRAMGSTGMTRPPSASFTSSEAGYPGSVQGMLGSSRGLAMVSLIWSESGLNLEVAR